MALSVRPACHRSITVRAPQTTVKPVAAIRFNGRVNGALPVIARAGVAPMGARRQSQGRPSSHSAVFGQRLVISSVPHTRNVPSAAAGVRSRAQLAVQANLFSRLFRVVKAYIDSFVGSFEDPEKLLDRVVMEMTDDAVRMRQAAAQAIAAQRQMGARATTAQNAADQWLRRAELAVARGQDDLAREALSRRKALQTDADRLTGQAVAQQQACDQLSASVRVLEGKIAEAKGKKETLKARAASAKTSIAIQEMIGGLRSTSASSFAAFDRMEEKVMALEAEAQSATALATPDVLEARFAQLEGAGGVEDDLAALKQAVSQAGQEGRRQQAALPRYGDVMQGAASGGAPRSDVLDAELEVLRRRVRDTMY